MTSLHAIVVKAQNPLSDVGGWPSGAVTLLGGLYTAFQNNNTSNFNVVPGVPVPLSVLWHYVPFLRKFLRSGEIGSTFTSIVLESPSSGFFNRLMGSDAEKNLLGGVYSHRLEWDAVICTIRVT